MARVTHAAVMEAARAMRDSLYPYLRGTPLELSPPGRPGYLDYAEEILRAAAPLMQDDQVLGYIRLRTEALDGGEDLGNVYPTLKDARPHPRIVALVEVGRQEQD